MLTISLVFLCLSFRALSATEPLAIANNDLFARLLDQLSTDKENVFFSPFSISNALAILYSGANGTTAQQIRQVLGYNLANMTDQQIKDDFRRTLNQIKSLDANKYNLDIVNKILVQKDFNISETFKEEVQNNYNSEIESKDFFGQSAEVMNDINQWVRRQTRDKIQSLLAQPLPLDTLLVILNAIYFKGIFQTKFDKELTTDQQFFNHQNQQKTIKMMRRIGTFNYTEVEELDSKLLELPYTGDDIGLYVLLPNQRQGLTSLKNNITDFSVIETAINNLIEEDVNVMIPKFKIESKYSLPETLSTLGMNLVFGGQADLSRIDGRGRLFVSDVTHKAYIEVSEEGTEATAVTGIIILPASANIYPKRRPIFRADHPFMYFIRDKRNGMVLFGGYIDKL